MKSKEEKQPGKVLMPCFKCSKCGYINEMPQFAIRPGGRFNITLNNQRGMGVSMQTSRIDFVCVACNNKFTIGMMDYKEPKISN